MTALFSSPSVPDMPAPVVPPVPPEPPPEAAPGDNVVAEKAKLRKKKGDMANLMTGGLGLSQISPNNLYAHTLGGI